MKQRIKKILFDPVKSRILYDLSISFLTSIIFYLIFGLFSNISIPLGMYFFYPITVIILMGVQGIYTYQKISSLLVKSAIITNASLVTFVIFSIILGQFSPALILLSIVLAGLLIEPRIFLNLQALSFANVQIQAVVKGNAPILVVGGGGYIGSHVVEKLLSKGYSVRVFDKFIYGEDVLDDLRSNPKLQLMKGDISNVFELTLALQNTQAVIHLAGIVGDPASSLDPNVTRHMNITSTRLLRDTAKAFRIPRFIFASSCSVYGQADNVVHEDSSPNPVSLYAQSKIDSELELLRETADFFHPTVLRFATVFGHSRKPRFDLVANFFTAKAYNKEDITVFNGMQWRPMIHVNDIAECVVKVLESPLESVSRETFNVGDDSMNFTIMDIAKIAQEIASNHGKKIKIIEKDVPDDPRNYKVSFEKVSKKLNFNARITLEEGMIEMYEHFKMKSYKKTYSDPYYSNLEMTKLIQKEFYSDEYKKSHVTDFVDFSKN